MPAGDIGGTKTNLALASVRGNTLQLAQMQSYESQRYDGLAAIVRLFLATHSAQVERACFGVAGPVLCGQATVTNLPWQLSEDELQQTLGIAHIALINDLTALAYAIPVLLPGDLVTLQAGNVEPTGATAILAPGTGLGEGYLWWDGQRYRPGASEGGHADFGPAGPLQTRLLEWLRAEYGHVSGERVLSGQLRTSLVMSMRAMRAARTRRAGRPARGEEGRCECEMRSVGPSLPDSKQV